MKKIGRQVLWLGTGGENSRNGEGAFLRLRDGSILHGYTEYISADWADHAVARIAGVFSRDEGESWSERFVILEKPADAQNLMSVSFLRLGNGDVGLFYIHKLMDGTDKLMLVRSGDEGKTWSEPVNCLMGLEPDYYVLNNDRVLRLQNGRLIFAAARHHREVCADRQGNAAWEVRLMPGQTCFFLSDDDGRSWRKAERELHSPYPEEVCGYQEPGLYEFADGRLWCYIRTGMGYQYESFSEDGGETWTEARPNFFFSSPDSPMLVKRVEDLTVAVFNPIPNYNGRDRARTWGRTPYVLAVSDDDGKTFRQDRMFYVEDDLTNGYCYPSMLPVEGGLLLAYYHSNDSGICLNGTKVVKIMLEELR